MPDILTDKSSYERAYELYEILVKESYNIEKKLENSIESGFKNYEKRARIIDRGLDLVCNVLNTHSVQKIDEYVESLSIDELINQAVGNDAVKKYNIRIKELNTDEGIKNCVLITTYENNINRIGFAFDICSFYNNSLPYVRAYYEDDEKIVVGHKGSCQHVLLDLADSAQGTGIINIRPLEVKGKQALIHSLSTLVQELVNMEDKNNQVYNSFDYHISIQSYNSLRNKLSFEEMSSINEAFEAVGNSIKRNLEATLNTQYDDALYEKSRIERAMVLFTKLKDFQNSLDLDVIINPESLIKCADEFIKKGWKNEALDFYEKAGKKGLIHGAEKMLELHDINKALQLYEKAENKEGMIKCADEIIKISPKFFLSNAVDIYVKAGKEFLINAPKIIKDYYTEIENK